MIACLKLESGIKRGEGSETESEEDRVKRVLDYVWFELMIDRTGRAGETMDCSGRRVQ